MNTKQALIYVAVLLIGFILGWMVRPLPANNTDIDFSSRALVNDAVEQDTDSILPGETVATELKRDSIDPIKLLSDKLVVSNKTDLNYSDWSVEEILDYLITANVADYYGGNSPQTYILSDPKLINQLLDRFLDIDDLQAKQRVLELLSYSNQTDNYSVEHQILEKINLGVRTDEWLSVLGETGVYTTASIDTLNQQLDYFLDGQPAADAINAINKGTLKFFNKIPRETREAFTEQVQRHLTSEDVAVRGAALRSLAGFPVPDSEAFIVQALGDSNSMIRQSAMQSLMRGEFPSRSVSDALIALINDEENAYQTRVAATYALRRYNLEGQDYDDLYNFNLEMQSNQEQEQNSSTPADEEDQTIKN